MNIENNFQVTDIRWFKNCLANPSLVQKLQNIKLIVCDVDGSLTNAGIYVTSDGEGGRIFSVQDGYVVRPLLKAGVTLSLMSGKDNASTFQRARMLGIPEELCIVGILDKPPATKHLQERLNITRAQTVIFGDDFLDARVKQENLVSMFVCLNNAPFYIQAYADMVIPRGGGEGAFRLFADLVLYVQQKHFAFDLIAATLHS